MGVALKEEEVIGHWSTVIGWERDFFTNDR
jgi:hypothetical protein